MKAEDREELDATGDYIVDEKHKTVTLTESGMQKAEQMLLHRLNDGHSTTSRTPTSSTTSTRRCARTPSSSSTSTTW